MKLTLLAKDASSGKHGCMGLHADADDPATMVAVVKRSRRARRHVPDLLPGETAGFIPAETVIAAARAYLAKRGETL